MPKSKADDAVLTPMLRQYHEIKARHRDAILFFRLGDFYEMFNDDARTASRVLDLTLTRKAAGKGGYIPLAGIPYHAAEGYITRLLKKGFKVAICEQVEDPAQAKGLVKREVIRVVTPGTLTEPGQLAARENNFLAAVFALPDPDGVTGFAAVDLSTGEFLAARLDDDAELAAELARFRPAEIIYPAEDEALAARYAACAPAALWTPRPGWEFSAGESAARLKEHFGVREIGGLCSPRPEVIGASGSLLSYLYETQKAMVGHILRMREFSSGDGMILDESTIRNLEIVQSSLERQRHGSLLWTIDQSVTAAGGRLLQRWLLRPLTDVAEITGRHERVAAFVDEPLVREEVRELLRGTSDLQRLCSRICLGRANPRDLLGVETTLRQVPVVSNALAGEVALAPLRERLDPCPELADEIGRAIDPQAPVTLRDGGVIRPGFSGELDALRRASRGGKEWITQLQEAERQRTGIPSLKVGYNRVFGYYIEITNAHRDAVPEDYERKQTLTNSERYITPELKEKEAFILGAEEKMLVLEERLFTELRDFAASFAARLQALAELLAELDVYAGLAATAARHRYIRPVMTDGDSIDIKNSRHPVIEQMVTEEAFVPNDIYLGGTDDRLMVITGPNMAGKSTYIRQAALIVLLAQAGSFVPAGTATIGVCDRIFTRVGAADQLARGRSTFMVEMIETALILNRATARSLIVLDEIGRGTSTYDGLAIAWAVAEHIVGAGGIQAKTLFATHYHELTEMVRVLPGVKNYNVAVREWNDEIIFLRRIVPGGADRSYGIQVGRLAGLPPGVIARAKEILFNLEEGELGASNRPKLAAHLDVPDEVPQPSLFDAPSHPLVDELGELRVEGMTPLEALNKLAELAEKAKKE